jgi:hypothetical protein
MEITQAVRDKVVAAIVASHVGAEAKMEAARLVEGWMDFAPMWPDTKMTVLGVECLWRLELEEKTIAVGVVDRISCDEAYVPLFSEWKTRRAPKLKLNGEPYKGDDEGSWLEEISGGPQLAVYALAARDGLFLLSDEAAEWTKFEDNPEPTVLVRCAVKSKPVDVWPMKPQDGVFSFPTAVLDATRDALVVKAHAIRAARKLGLVPWQMMGYHCKTYNRDCEHLPLCRTHQHPPAEPQGWQHAEDVAPDPGYKVAALLGLDVHDPELVVLSQSAYQTYSRCMEKGRIDYGGHVKGETSYELEVGSAFHEGVAEFNRQLQCES